MNTKFEELSEIQKNLFSMNGNIQLIKWQTHLDDSYQDSKFYKNDEIIKLIEKCKRKEANYYGETDLFLYEALDKYSIKDKPVAILGSAKPWYESVCLAYEAHPHTIEYNQIETDCDSLKISTVDNFYKNPVKFDFAFSISSFEHDGLGRYGDPINPNGDLEAMLNVKNKILNKGGILFLSVPVGIDKVVWNAHRIYGAKRLPILLKNFKLIDTFGFSNKDLNIDSGTGVVKQPIFVLENI